jgi:mono/diheme cytochrome c family protein
MYLESDASLRFRRSAYAWSILAACSLAASAWAGASGAPTPKALPRAANLLVLPRDTRPEDIDRIMRRYSRELGVRCSYCHAEDPVSHEPDYALDEPPAKLTARVMIAMLNDINARYLAQLGDLRYVEPITCGTCHRGESSPPSFDANDAPSLR